MPNYDQMDKNNVAASGQLKNSSSVRFYGKVGKRIMLVGNSITLHGKKPDIGWHGEWGMAASCEQNDYVHRIMSAASGNSFCVCQVAEWERQYNNNVSLDKYQDARDFDADIIVMRFIENCPKKDFDPVVFKKELGKFLGYLNKSGNADIIITTGFWHHPGDDAIRQYAAENGLPCIELGDLGERDDMKAIGLFEHNGVANHPGDLGMQNIASRILEVLKNYI